MEINEADFRWQRHILSSEQAPWDPNVAAAERSPDISISITTETGHTTLDPDMGEIGLGLTRTTPEESVPCAVQEGTKPEPGLEPDHGSPREEGGCRGDNGGGGDKQRAAGGVVGGVGAAPPDVVQRSHALVYPDITNFLSVESRTRSHHGGGSRYSESNFRYRSANI